MEPPFIPPVKDAESTAMVDPAFTSEEPTLSIQEGSKIKDSAQSNFEDFTYVAGSAMPSA
jgi:Protein kinase C terminal domain